MKSPINEKEFYQEVDRSRYRANWSCLIWFFILGTILIGGGWLLAKNYGWL